jgi:hypothetical protein
VSVGHYLTPILSVELQGRRYDRHGASTVRYSLLANIEVTVNAAELNSGATP